MRKIFFQFQTMASQRRGQKLLERRKDIGWIMKKNKNKRPLKVGKTLFAAILKFMLQETHYVLHLYIFLIYSYFPYFVSQTKFSRKGCWLRRWNTVLHWHILHYYSTLYFWNIMDKSHKCVEKEKNNGFRSVCHIIQPSKHPPSSF